MSIFVKALLLVIVFVAGYTLPYLTPEKVAFSNQLVPKTQSECIWDNKVCISKNYKLTIYRGNFSPLAKTTFGLIGDGVTDLDDTLLVTSDDQRFGIIEAYKSHDGQYSVLIPFCSNDRMRIIIFSVGGVAIKLPEQV
ncbi:hypothetical protein [Vibrio sp. THAF190c]|uniref:hypothetical protein n=1 Tax=Vibrio sp. THAF190c TaxID=2587865 RepID=UPI001268324C|nr:hypothetical protein [Vibrio sp. THAF190c]QFT11491.1 hypothetical protein FIV04_16345 [Vibrio sp. THAF190c]